MLTARAKMMSPAKTGAERYFLKNMTAKEDKTIYNTETPSMVNLFMRMLMTPGNRSWAEARKTSVIISLLPIHNQINSFFSCSFRSPIPPPHCANKHSAASPGLLYINLPAFQAKVFLEKRFLSILKNSTLK